MYPNGQGSWARTGRGRRCAQASPSWLALHARIAAWALPSWFALLAHCSGFALTTIEWIQLLQSNKFIHFALQNLWIHLQNLWIHILNEFSSKWIHLLEKKKRKKSTRESNQVPTINTHSAMPPSTCYYVFYNIYPDLIYDSYEWENDVTNYYRWIHLRFCSRQRKKHMNNLKLK